jgi:hypothetical protein
MPLLLDVSPPSFALMPFRHCHYFLLMLLRAFIFIFSFFIDAAFFFSLPAMTRRTSAPRFCLLFAAYLPARRMPRDADAPCAPARFFFQAPR